MMLIDEAQRLAEAHREILWPCPVCAAEVKGRNLGSHLGKHDDATLPERWEGRDRATVVPAAVGFVVAIGGAVAIAAVASSAARPVEMLLAAIATGALGLIAASLLDKLKATLQLEDGQLTVTYAFGLRRRRLDLADVDRIEVGTLKEGRSSPFVDYDSVPVTNVKVGSYLRLSAGSKRMTLASKKSIGVQHRWEGDGLERGAVRHHWDALVPSPALIAISLALSERGVLRPRG